MSLSTELRDPAPVTVPPTRVRYGVVIFAVTLALITYLDRVCIAQAGPFMMKDLSISKVEMGYVYLIFAWMYGLFEIPWGWLGDRIGPRKILMRIVVCWSVFTAATGLVVNSASLMVTQGLFGAGEAGCFPNVAKCFTTWLPSRERVRAQGLLWLSARWGGAFTPLVVVYLLKIPSVSWRHVFWLFAVVGVVWAILFNRWYRDDPRRHPGVNDAELALLPRDAAHAESMRVPWRGIVSSPSVWMLWIQYFFLAYGAYFYITWLPQYLNEARHVKLEKGAFLAAFPLFFAGLGSLFCGFFLSRLADWIGGPRRARRLMAIVGFLGSCGFMLLSTRIENTLLAMIVMGLAGFSNDLVMPSSWGASMDMGGRFAGTLSASMNMMSCLGAGVAAWVTGHVLQWTSNNWNLVLYISAAAYFIGALCWLFLDPVTPIVGTSKEAIAWPAPSSAPSSSISSRPGGATTS